MQLAGLYEQWKKSVVPTQRQLDAVLEGDAPFGTPSEHVATMKDTEAFSKLLRGDDRAPPASDSKIKVPGSNEIHLPEKYQHLKEVIEAIVADQEENNPLFKHSAMFFTFRQTIGTQRPPRRVHIDPPRTNNSVDKDQIYFISDKETTLTQSELVKDPADTLNRLKPEIMIEQGFLNRAEPYELRKGTEDTYHVQGADTYTDGRTFMRMIVSHPESGYFHDLSDEEKAELPEDFRMKLGIVFEDNGLTIA